MAANYDAHSPPPVYIWGRLLKQCSSTLCSILVNLLLLINIIYTCMLISNYESTGWKLFIIVNYTVDMNFFFLFPICLVINVKTYTIPIQHSA